MYKPKTIRMRTYKSKNQHQEILSWPVSLFQPNHNDGFEQASRAYEKLFPFYKKPSQFPPSCCTCRYDYKTELTLLEKYTPIRVFLRSYRKPMVNFLTIFSHFMSCKGKISARLQPDCVLLILLILIELREKKVLELKWLNNIIKAFNERSLLEDQVTLSAATLGIIVRTCPEERKYLNSNWDLFQCNYTTRIAEERANIRDRIVERDPQQKRRQARDEATTSNAVATKSFIFQRLKPSESAFKSPDAALQDETISVSSESNYEETY